MPDLRSVIQGLYADGEDVPQAVRRCAPRLEPSGIWYCLTRNKFEQKAGGCEHAAQIRWRLGHQGIPLWDEMKSYLGEFQTPSGEWIIFLAHYRGDRDLSFEQLKKAFPSATEFRHADAKALGMDFGLVNPWLADPGWIQVFDLDLLEPIEPPRTVMTNFGDKTLAIEFYPRELADCLPNVRRAEITEHRARAKKPTIGIIGGNPHDSAISLSAMIVALVREHLGEKIGGDVYMPEICPLMTPNIGHAIEIRQRSRYVKEDLLQTEDRLLELGFNLITHPAFTTSIFKEDLKRRAGKAARFISITDVTIARIKAMSLREFILIGTEDVVDLDSEWSPFRNAFDNSYTIHRPKLKGMHKLIKELGLAVQQGWMKGSRDRQRKCACWLRDIIRLLAPKDSKSCQDVVLAITELSEVEPAMTPADKSFMTLHNPLRWYAEAITKAWLGLPED